MSIRSRIADAIGGRKSKTTVSQEENYRIHVNALCSAYENLFAQVRPLIDEMKIVRPFGVGRNGAKLDKARTPELNVLDYPNEQMGWAEFADAMFATWLTEDELNIRVHFGKNGKTVIGYTLLPVGSRSHDLSNGQSYFKVWTNEGEERISADEVATLRFSRSPRNLDKGVSPASSVFVWSQIDDMVAQYQRAFFENGAVPATITFIKARTRDDYDLKRAKLENGLRGAKNKNKTIYVWRQLLDDGTEGDEIEVKTIQGNNSTLALKELTDIINDKLNKAIGVSNFILGDDSSAKYDNAELSDHQFTKRRVYPALVSFWSQFQHEMDRITGGLGYAISFELEIPELTDRLKTKAEIDKSHYETLRGMIEAGSKPSSAIAALGLGQNWQSVADGFYVQHLVDRQREAVANTLRGSETAQESVQDSKTVVEPSHDDVQAYEPVFGLGEENEKKIYDLLMEYAEQIVKDNPNIDTDKLVEELNGVLKTVAEDGSKAGYDVIQGLVYGEEVAEQIAEYFEAEGFKLSDDFYNAMNRRTDALVKSFGSDTKDIVRGVFAEASETGMTANQLRERLQEAMPKARAEMIARNETVHAFRSGRLETDEYIQDHYGVQIDLVWRIADNGACDVCKAMDGTRIPVGEAFPDHESHDGEDFYWEHTSWNDDGKIPQAHVNCRCYFDEVVR